MSIISNARTYADTAVEDGKSTLTATQERLGSLAGETRERARGAVDDTRGLAFAVVTLTRQQAYAQLGASDAVVAVITKRSAELPGETKQKTVQLIESSKDRLNKTAERVAAAQDKVASVASDVKDRGNAVVRSVRTSPTRVRVGVKNEFVSRVEKAKDAYLKLGERGEQVAVDLRHDPVVARVISDADTRVEQAANQLTSVAQKVRARAASQAEREKAAATSTPVRPTAARQVPAHRTIVRNTPAGEAAISTTPIHRAAAHETEIRKAAAVKAAETRQERALEREEAAQARSDAAAKAAATRKENAEQAVAKREAAAAKAARTRKKTAQAREQATQARSETATKAAATRKRNAAKASSTQAG
jgi:hypothetical protein